MNRRSFSITASRVLTTLVLLTMLCPASLGMPLAVTPAHAAPLAEPLADAKALQPKAPLAAIPSLSNNSFENGSLSGWTVNASGHVEVLQSSNLLSSPLLPISPTDGTYMALVCNGPGTIDPAELDNLDGDLGPNNDNDRSILSQAFTVGTGDIPLVLEFDWNWLTSESPTPGNFDDFFMVTLNSDNILNGSAATGGVSPFPDVPVNGSEYQVESTGSTNGCFFNDGQSGWKHFSYVITTPGVYTLSILVSDQGNNDHAIDSGLLVDNFQLALAADLSIQKSASPHPVVIAGEELFYTLTVDNLGSGLASSVVVTDTLPADLLFMGSTAFCSEGYPGQLTCSLGDLAAGDSHSFVIKTLVPSDMVVETDNGTLEITNQAGVSSSSPELNPNNNYVATSVLVQGQANLKVTKMVKPDTTVLAGELFTYTIYIENLGPSVAQGGSGRDQGVSLRDEMLSDGAYTIVQTILDPNRVDQGPFYETAPSGGTTMEFDLLQDLEVRDVYNGGRWVIQIVALANQAMDVNNCITAFGRGTSSTPDPDLSNNTSCEGISVESTADLSLSLNSAVSPVNAGERATFNVSVQNNGPSFASNVEFEAVLPAGFVDGSMVVSSLTQGSCNVGTPGDPLDPLRCNLGNLASGATLSFQISGDVDSAFYLIQPVTPTAYFIALDAQVSSDTFDMNMGNNLATNFVAINESANLSLRKFAVGTPVAGQEFHYEYQIRNAGPSYARNLSLRDFLPSQVEFVSAFVDYSGLGQTPVACEITVGSNVLFCPLGDVPPTGAQPVMVFVNVRIKPDASGTLTNSADVNQSDTPDPDNTNNTASVSVTVRSQVDLKISKTSSPSPAIAGLELFYTLTALNQGPSLAHNVVITDYLPEGAMYLADNGDCLVDEMTSELVCALGDLSPGESASLVIKTSLSAFLLTGSENNTLTLYNEASVSSDETDSNPADNQVSQASFVQGLADLAVTKLSSPDTHVQAGEIFTYTILVDNFGPSAARFIAFQDYMFSSGAVTLLNVVTDTYRMNVCMPLEDTITCVLLDETGLEPAGTINPLGDFSPYLGRWKVQIVAQANEAQDIHNLVTVMPLTVDLFPMFALTGTPDPNMSNNQAQDFITVDAAADLRLTKGDNLGPDPAIAGEVFTYTLEVANDGPSTAENVVLVDALPAEVEALGYVAPDGTSCTLGTPGNPGDPAICNLGTIPSGMSALVSIPVRVKPEAGAGTVPDHLGTIQNNAWTYAETYDPNNANNRATLNTGLLGVADLFIVKNGPDEVAAGETATYFLTFGNLGPSTTHDIEIRDILNYFTDVVDWAVVDLTPGSVDVNCEEVPGFLVPSTLACYFDQLPPGFSATLAVRVHYPPGLISRNYLDLAQIFSTSYDPDESNNIDGWQTHVYQEADLAITKSGDPAKVRAGEQVKYTLVVTNHGPSLATDVLATDTLPEGITYETGPTTCARVSSDPEEVSCELGGLLPGASQTIELYAKVLPDAPTGENLVNFADVDSVTEDPNDGNNAATANTFIEGMVDLRVTKFGKPDDVVSAGTPLIYTIVVDNFGPSYAHQVTILDQIVASGGFELLDLSSDRPADCNPPGHYAAQTITCVLTGTLEPAWTGNVGRWMVTATVIANEPGSIDNLVRVTSADFDPDLSNNEARVEHEISAVVDLQVTKTAVGEIMVNGELLQWGEDWPWGLTNLWPDLPMGSWVNSGRVLTYTLTITNNGPSTAQNIVVKDYLPEGVAPPDLPPTSTLPIDYEVRRVNVLPPSQASCLWGVLGDPATPLECNLDSLPGGQAAQIQVVISIPAGVPVGTYYYNRVRVYNDLFDPLNGNNVDGLFTVVVPPIWVHFLPVINRFINFP